MIDWIIYYDDGSTFTGQPEDAPREGVVVIAYRDISVGKRLVYDCDTYCWQDGVWVPHDRIGCERYLNMTKHPIRLLGFWVKDEIFEARLQQALNDPRLPFKTARHPREPR